MTQYSQEEVVYEDNVCLAILPRKGHVQGYIKVIPKQKASSLKELPEDVVVQLFYVASYAATAVFEGLGAHGTNIIVHDGDFKKNSNYQLELLVIPRKEEDGIDFKWETKETSQEELELIKNRIKDQTFLIGKEKKAQDGRPSTAESSNNDESKDEIEDDGENYFVKHLIRIP